MSFLSPVSAPGASRADTIVHLRTHPARSQDLAFWPLTFVRAPLPQRVLSTPVRVTTNGALVSTLTSGQARQPDGSVAPVGLPYGMLARLIVLFLITYAVQKGTRRVPLGASVSRFLRLLGIAPTGGAQGRLGYVYDQLSRLAACSLSERWSFHDANAASARARRVEVGSNTALVERFALWQHAKLPGPSAIALAEGACTDLAGTGGVFELSPALFEQARAAAVPVDLRAVRVLRASPLAFDAYVWVTHKAACLERDGLQVAVVSWEQLYEQFGRPCARRRDFSRAFVQALDKVRLFWPALTYYVPRGRLVLACNAPHVPRSR